MKRIGWSLVATLAFTALTVTTSPFTSFISTTYAQAKQSQTMIDEPQSTYRDIEQTLGSVPTFIRSFPEQGLPGAWEEWKAIELAPDTAIPSKYKSLISLAVASQVPCSYCIYADTKSAMNEGATQQEIQEAVAIAGITRHWSTVLNGSQIDDAAFRAEVNEMLEFASTGASSATTTSAPPAIVDAATAYQDIEATLGQVPTFMRRFPSAGIAGAWKTYKATELNPETAVPNRYKELIGLAVASQIPCHYCVYFHEKAAKLNGATEAEIGEAIAMSALARQWSTVLNGTQVDMKTFQREFDGILTHASAGADAAKR